MGTKPTSIKANTKQLIYWAARVHQMGNGPFLWVYRPLEMQEPRRDHGIILLSLYAEIVRFYPDRRSGYYMLALL